MNIYILLKHFKRRIYLDYWKLLHYIDGGIDEVLESSVGISHFQEYKGLFIAVEDCSIEQIPHIHVFKKLKDVILWKNGACLLFEENKYFDHLFNHERLNIYDIEIINEFLNNKFIDVMTQWDLFKESWNSMNDTKILINEKIEYDYKTISILSDR